MKTSIRSFSVLFILFSFSILFVSCSQESSITSPNESKATGMEKTTVKVVSIPTVKINHTTDTVITLPKSKKTLRLSKSLTADKIAKLDEYLLTHSIGTAPAQTVSPNLRNCTQYTEASWYELGIYRSVSGKHLGIWDEQRISNWQNYYNNWGFNEIYLSNSSEYTTANNNNTLFKTDSILADLNKYNYQANVQS